MSVVDGEGEHRAMSFGNFARKVRDPALPHQRRSPRSVPARSSTGRSASRLSFLQAKAGPFRTDEAALVRALAVLEASRSVRQEEKQAYEAARREAKQRGQRSPRPGDTNPYTPTEWYGARREAALHTIAFWQQRRLAALIRDDDKPSQHLRECVQACLDSGGRLPPGRRLLLADCIDQLTARLQPPSGTATRSNTSAPAIC